MDTGTIVELVGWGFIGLVIVFWIGVIVHALTRTSSSSNKSATTSPNDYSSLPALISVILLVVGIIVAFIGFLIRVS